MGKRTRRQQQSHPAKRSPQQTDPAKQSPEQSGERQAKRPARRFAAAERSIRERPPAPWDPFPLAELAVLIGLVALIIGWLTVGDVGRALMAGGFTLAALGGLDTVFREHFNGYRSHAGVIAGLLMVLALVISTALLDIGIAPRAAIAVAVFGLAFTALRRDFIRRSGGRRVL